MVGLKAALNIFGDSERAFGGSDSHRHAGDCLQQEVSLVGDTRYEGLRTTLFGNAAR